MKNRLPPTVTSTHVLKRLWEQGIDVDRKDEETGSTALHQAAEVGSRVIVWFLLKRGADVNVKDKFGRTALHLACESLHSTRHGVAELLLEYGAKVNLQTIIWETPLHVACWAMDKRMVDMLLQNRANLDLVDRNGLTPLHVVAHLKKNDSCMVDAMLKFTAHVNAVDSVGRSPLHWACFFEGIWTVYALLIKGGANVNQPDSSGDTPLHLACVNNGREIVSMLVSKGADTGAKNTAGRTALHLAALYGSADVVDVLVDNGADFNAQDSADNTPLHLTISWVSKNVCVNVKSLSKIIVTLLDRGANLNVKNSLQRTPYEDIIELEQQFCSKDFESSSDKDKLKKVAGLFVEHVIKLKTANLPIDIDITSKLGPVQYDILQTICAKEIICMKSIIITERLSLYHVFSHFDDRAHSCDLLSRDELLKFDECLRSPEMMKQFSVYGPLLKNTFQKLKVLTRPVSWCEEAAYDDVFYEHYDKISQKSVE